MIPLECWYIWSIALISLLSNKFILPYLVLHSFPNLILTTAQQFSLGSLLRLDLNRKVHLSQHTIEPKFNGFRYDKKLVHHKNANYYKKGFSNTIILPCKFFLLILYKLLSSYDVSFSIRELSISLNFLTNTVVILWQNGYMSA